MLLFYIGFYIVCYVICVIYWIYVGGLMLLRISLELIKFIILLNCFFFDVVEFWCIISLKVINILFEFFFLVNFLVDVYMIYSYVYVYGFELY